MTQPTWQEITAEAIRRKAQALANGWGDIELEALIVQTTREGWKPLEPEPVDPDLLAFREWAAENAPALGAAEAYRKGLSDNTHYAQCFLAGARMAREQESERFNHPVAFAVRVMAGAFKDLDSAKREAREALARIPGRA